jgi:hypothetical protein
MEKGSKIAVSLHSKSLNASNNIEHIDGPEGLDAVPESIEHAIHDGIDLNGTPLPKEMVGFYKEVMQKEAERICRVRVAMRKKIIATGSKHYDQETMNQRLLDAGWEGLKAAEIAYFFS